VVRAPYFGSKGPRFETRALRIFQDLRKGVRVLDDGAGRRKGAVAVYTAPDRADWVFGAPESTIGNVVGCKSDGLDGLNHAT
jgi:hypothetical protein